MSTSELLQCALLHHVPNPAHCRLRASPACAKARQMDARRRLLCPRSAHRFAPQRSAPQRGAACRRGSLRRPPPWRSTSRPDSRNTPVCTVISSRRRALTSAAALSGPTASLRACLRSRVRPQRLRAQADCAPGLLGVSASAKAARVTRWAVGAKRACVCEGLHLSLAHHWWRLWQRVQDCSACERCHRGARLASACVRGSNGSGCDVGGGVMALSCRGAS